MNVFAPEFDAAFNGFLREMPRMSCDCHLLSIYGASCTERPTVMLDEHFERTFNPDNMEYELTEDCYRRFLRGEL